MRSAPFTTRRHAAHAQEPGNRAARALVAGTAALAALVACGSAVLFYGSRTEKGRHGVGRPFARRAGSLQRCRDRHLGRGTRRRRRTRTWTRTRTRSPARTRHSGTPAGRDLTRRTIRNVVHTSVGGAAARITLSNLYGHARCSHRPPPPRQTPGRGGTMRAAPRPPVRPIPAGGAVHQRPRRVARRRATPTSWSPRTPPPRPGPSPSTRTPTRPPTRAATAPRTPPARVHRAEPVLALSHRAGRAQRHRSRGRRRHRRLDHRRHHLHRRANHRWPDFARRPAAHRARHAPLQRRQPGHQRQPLLLDGLGIGASHEQRAERAFRPGRAAAVAGVKAVVIELGINDMLLFPQQRDPQKITDGAARTWPSGARPRAARRRRDADAVRGAPRLRPRGGRTAQVNAQIRAGSVYDDVVDFDKALRDPYQPRRLRPRFDSGDHLHPNDQGYRRLGQRVRSADPVPGEGDVRPALTGDVRRGPLPLPLGRHLADVVRSRAALAAQPGAPRALSAPARVSTASAGALRPAAGAAPPFSRCFSALRQLALHADAALSAKPLDDHPRRARSPGALALARSPKPPMMPMPRDLDLDAPAAPHAAPRP